MSKKKTKQPFYKARIFVDSKNVSDWLDIIADQLLKKEGKYIRLNILEEEKQVQP